MKSDDCARSEYLGVLVLDYDIQMHFAVAHMHSTDRALGHFLHMPAPEGRRWVFWQGRGVIYVVCVLCTNVSLLLLQIICVSYSAHLWLVVLLHDEQTLAHCCPPSACFIRSSTSKPMRQFKLGKSFLLAN